MSKIRNTAFAGAAAIAMVAAGSLAAPTHAHANGKVVAGIVGGLAVGAFLGAAAHAHPYGYPAYYGSPCHFEKRKVWNPAYGYYTWQTVKVCY